MEIGFSARLAAKHGFKYAIPAGLPQPVEEMARSMRSLKNLVASLGELSDEGMRNTMESINTSSEDNLYLIIRKSVYAHAKSNAVACSLLGQFVLDRFKTKDHLSVHVVLSVLRQLVVKFEKEKPRVIQAWTRDVAPVSTDPSKSDGVLFSEKHGLLDPFLPLLRSFLNVFYLNPARVFDLFDPAHKNAIQIIMTKFLVPLATKHWPSHLALLHLIIHIQSLLRQHESSSVMNYSYALNALGQVTESLILSLSDFRNHADYNDAINLYMTIRNTQDKFGPEYAFTYLNAPKVLEVLGPNSK